jgi:hypothetical protein
MNTRHGAYFGWVLPALITLILLQVGYSKPVWAQQEVTSDIYRYRERVATGYYEGYEVSPRRMRARIEIPGVKRGLFPFGSASSEVRLRGRLPDSHRGLKFYERNTCIDCHPREARDLHSTRAGITCRQCHGPEPIPAINYYYSPLNPIRRHAYVCAKCHEGATANFAGFHVHEPPAGSLETLTNFPVLFIVYWAMILLLLGTLAFFVPHAFMVGFRELTETRAFSAVLRPMEGLMGLPKKWVASVIHFFNTVMKNLSPKGKTRKNEADDAD